MAEPTRYALLATREADGEYLHLRVRAVAVADDGSPRNLIGSTYGPDADPLYGLMITAQADRRPPADTGVQPYGWRFGFAPFLPDSPARPSEVAAALGTLRRIARALDRLDTRYGQPATFGQYVARIADALGLPVMTGHASRDGWYSGGDYVTWTSGEAVSVLDGWTAEHRRGL